jgi:hypothetical protein
MKDAAANNEHLQVGRRLRDSLDGLLRVDVVGAPHDPALTRSRQRLEQQTTKRAIIVRVEEEPSGEPRPRRWRIDGGW